MSKTTFVRYAGPLPPLAFDVGRPFWGMPSDQEEPDLMGTFIALTPSAAEELFGLPSWLVSVMKSALRVVLEKMERQPKGPGLKVGDVGGDTPDTLISRSSLPPRLQKSLFNLAGAPADLTVGAFLEVFLRNPDRFTITLLYLCRNAGVGAASLVVLDRWARAAKKRLAAWPKEVKWAT